jgi:base plate protein
MSAPPSAQLLETWERGLGLPPALRTLTLLGASKEGSSLEGLAHLTIGELDRQLLQLRERTFGGCLNAITTCPTCNEKLEVSLSVADLCLTAEGKPPASLMLERNGYRIEFRLPNGFDLLALDQDADTTHDRMRLLQRCVLSARRETDEIPAANLPDEIVTAIAAKMAEADPQADMLISLRCPQCMHQWLAPLDISSFFWSELDAWAAQLLRDVHSFALAYGWNETDILALSATRRRLYLEMIGK